MCANTDKGFGVLFFWYVPGRLGPFGFGSAVLTRRPRKGSRRKAQGSGFKGSGFRLLKVQSAVLAAQGLGFGVWGLGLKAEGSGFRLQGFRLQAQVQAAGLWAGFRLGREPGRKPFYRPRWPFYRRFIKPKQPVIHFIARRPFNGGPWTFYEAKAARRPFYRP